jgi:predicted DNA-binding transcriptional regulator YafY
MLQIVTALQSSHNNQIDDMAEMHQLSRRTIFRDLKVLKEIGNPFKYNPKTGSYSMLRGFLYIFLLDKNKQR